MSRSFNHISRRSVLATAVALFSGIGSSRVTRKPTSSEASTGEASTESRLLAENPTNRPLQLSLSVSNRPVSAFAMANRQGEGKAVEIADGDLDIASAARMEGSQTESETDTIFDRQYTVEANSALLFRLRGMPEQGQLLYTLERKSAGEASSVETRGRISCSSRFDVFLGPSESRSSCGSRISEIDRYDGATERTIRLGNATPDGD